MERRPEDDRCRVVRVAWRPVPVDSGSCHQKRGGGDLDKYPPEGAGLDVGKLLVILPLG